MANKKEPISIRQERLDLDEIKTLLETLEKHEVTEFKLERDDEKLWLKRGPDTSGQASQASYPPPQYAYPPMYQTQGFSPQQASAPQPAQSTQAGTPNITLVPNSPLDSKSYKEVRSPMVGTFYRRPAVDAEAYVNVGDTVKKGDVLCIVEAMKLMNEIESELSGKVVEICLEDGQMVEYGEVIFKIDQN